jgi:Metallo-beta-lactamase superfamily
MDAAWAGWCLWLGPFSPHAQGSAICGPLEFIGSAQAQSYANAKLIDKGFYKFKVGDVEVTQIYDGIWNRAFEDNFVKNAPADQVKAALKAGGLADNIIPIPFTVTVVKMKSKYVMFDSGTGGQVQPTAGLLAAKNMKAAGIDPAKIETIIVTHFHPDHIFGLMAKDTNAQTYQNATIYLPKPELVWWTGSSVPQPAQGISNRVKATSRDGKTYSRSMATRKLSEAFVRSRRRATPAIWSVRANSNCWCLAISPTFLCCS